MKLLIELLRIWKKFFLLSTDFSRAGQFNIHHHHSAILVYLASRGFSLACRLAFTKSLVSLVCRVVGFCWGVQNKPTTRLTSDANDFVNAKKHAREKPLLAGYFRSGCSEQLYPNILVRHRICKILLINSLFIMRRVN